MKAQVVRLEPKNIVFKDYKQFDELSFLEDMHSVEISRNSNCPNENYIYLTCRFLSIVNKYARTFKIKNYSKEFYRRSALKKKYLKHPTNLISEL